MLGVLAAFALDRAEAGIVDEVRTAHAVHYVVLSGELTRRARTDDSRAAAEQAHLFCPEVNAAVHWALAHGRPDLALPLARALSVGGEQYGLDLESLASIAKAARDPGVREVARPQDLLDIGQALSFGDLELVAELATLALKGADDDPSLLAAHHLAGLADAYRHRRESARAHLDLAERLADDTLDMWQLASVRQSRGIAMRGPDQPDPEAALAAFGSAIHAYALAGDAMHVNNARYMMALVAAESGVQTERASSWVEECLAYARDSANAHELAHALLTRVSLGTSPDERSDLDEAVETFRGVGDLRCLTRSHLQLASRVRVRDRATMLERALDYARKANDVDHQVTTLERLIRVRWDSGDRSGAAATFGALVNLVGHTDAAARCPAAMATELDEWVTAIAQGRAHAQVP